MMQLTLNSVIADANNGYIVVGKGRILDGASHMSRVSVRNHLGSRWSALSVDGYSASAGDRVALYGSMGVIHTSEMGTAPGEWSRGIVARRRGGCKEAVPQCAIHALEYPGRMSPTHPYYALFSEFSADPERERYVHFLVFSQHGRWVERLFLELLTGARFEPKSPRSYCNYRQFTAECRALLVDLLDLYAEPAILANARLHELGFHPIRL